MFPQLSSLQGQMRSTLFLFTCVCACAYTCRCLESRRGLWVPGAGVTGYPELPDAGLRSKLRFPKVASAFNCWAVSAPIHTVVVFNQLKTWVWTHVCVPVCAQRLISFLPSLYKPRQREPGASQFCVTSQEPTVPPRLGSQAAKSVELVCGGWESILHARVLFPWHRLPIFLYHSFWRLPQIL